MQIGTRHNWSAPKTTGEEAADEEEEEEEEEENLMRKKLGNAWGWHPVARAVQRQLKDRRWCDVAFIGYGNPVRKTRYTPVCAGRIRSRAPSGDD